ncbi:hypothetical protein B2J93_6554 [Marssonina coronariae]|uniref:NAD/NADP octopine/nopaline dehydrogenase n=1 Tax=Diplocarpon coronariae TaxID=2795749 RepID=A0A218Z078_9HELO|nr:hypothetical protein B2J93_6554 [Marssonina coronariae]
MKRSGKSDAKSVPRKVSILGAGPSGFALAADLSSRGTAVLLYSHPEHLRHAQPVLDQGDLLSSWPGVAEERCTKVNITTDMRAAADFSDLMIMTVPSTGQETLLGEMRGLDLSLHTLVAVPGNLFSLLVGETLKIGCVVETNISPYSCRISAGHLQVFGVKSSFNIAAHPPSTLTPRLHSRITSLFSQTLRWSSSVLEVSLSNINGVFHPLMMLLNAGSIEVPPPSRPFLLYSDGLTPAVARAMLAVDRVRLDIGEKMGFDLDGVLETSNRCYDARFASLVELARNSGPHKDLAAPSSLRHRNVEEDVPDLLVCWAGLARKLGLDAGPLEAVVGIAGMMMGRDFWAQGRSLERLHLEGLEEREIVERFGGFGGSGWTGGDDYEKDDGTSDSGVELDN